MRVNPDQIINGFDAAYYLLTQPDVAAAGIDPLAHFNLVGWQEGRKPNGIFDPAYYLAQYPDVAAAGVNPLHHYLLVGASEGRNPSAAFDTNAYLAAHPDVAAAGVNPLLHYLQNGAFEGRVISGNLTVGSAGNDYLVGTSGADVMNGGAGNDFAIGAGGNDSVDGGAGIDTVRFSGNFLDYTFSFNGNQVTVSGPEGQDTFSNFERFAFRDVAFDSPDSTPLFDEFYYYALNPDVYAAGVDAAFHFAAIGWKEGRDPNQYFDTSYYLSTYPDVAAAGINPLDHYLIIGATEGRNPSALFDTAAYLAAYPDVAAAGMNPLLHFLAFGQSEGRSPLGTLQTSVTAPEDTDHVFTSADFDFGGLGSVDSVTIDASGISNGTLFVDANDDGVIDGGEALFGAGNAVAMADISAGRLIFRPDANENGNAYVAFGYTGTDGSSTSTPGLMTVNVTPVNDAPRNILFTQSNPLPEGAVAADAFGVVGTVTATDTEGNIAGNNAFTYSLVDSFGGVFAIDANGQITVVTTNALALDFEINETHTVELIVRVTDSGSPAAFTDQAISIALSDLTEQTAHAVEGYIAGGTVFIDEDNSGTLTAGDYTVTTDAFGQFKIVGNHTGDMYLTGGTDLATGLAFTGVLRAPSGSTVLSPLTTLIAALVDAGATAAVATQQVAEALGLDDTVDYTTYDPVAASLNGDANGDAAFAAGVQVYNTIVQAASLLSGAGANAADAADAVAGVIATQLQTAATGNTTVDLSQTTVLETVITNAAVIAPPATAVSNDTIQEAAQVISGTNTIIDNAAGSGSSFLVAVSGAANVAQGEAAAALFTAGNTDDGSTAVADYTGAPLDAEVATATAQVDANAVAGPNGDNDVVGTNNADTLDGEGGNDNVFGGGGKDILIGGAGNDVLYGDVLSVAGTRSMANDRADYSNATGPINVQLAAGTVTGDGNDTLVSVETVTGTNLADTFDATGFSATSTNGGGIGFSTNTGLGGMGNFNQFEGLGGNDTITGNGATRITYQSAAGGVTVTMTSLGAGTATGDASVGVDTFSGIAQVRGSNFNDSITGSQNGSGLAENLDGLGGDDFLDGNGGFDRVRYDFVSTGDLGIIVNLGAGTVTGRDTTATAIVGNDTLRSIEAIRGTHSADVYNASGFTATSTNGGNTGGFTGPQAQGNFNEFEGLGGDDQVTGNGNTRVTYYNATAGVNIVFTGFGVGTATGDASVGTDTFLGGVTVVRGSNHGDTFTGYNNGTGNFEQFEGMAGNDFIDGGLGLDLARYDANNADAAGMPLTNLGLSFNMAAGTATFLDAAGEFNYGTDTLRSIEAIRGTSSNDVYTAAGFSTSSTNAASSHHFQDVAAFNQFEGGLGDDDVTGNGTTRVNYQNSGSAVNVNLGSGATGGQGTDTFHGGINAVRGSNFDDTLTGTNNTDPNTYEAFEGLSGNDTIDGMGGFDAVRYDNHNTGGNGVVVIRNSVSSTVTRVNSGGANDGVGTDTLLNIESVRGTNFNDVYNATGFVGFNDVHGLGGNDDITGNGNTRINYTNASFGVNIDLLNNQVTGGAGTDTLHGGINAARGSQFADAIRGSAGNDTLTGFAGNDAFVFNTLNFGHDTVTDLVAGAGTEDFLQFDDSVFANFDAIMAAATQVGADTVITLDAGNTITLLNVTKTSLHANDFVITF